MGMARTTGVRRRRGAGQWQCLIEAFEAGGDSQAVFCRRRGLALSTFQYWRRRLRAEVSPETTEAAAGLIDLGELGSSSRGWQIELSLGEWVRLRIMRG
jgi:hypothetical protein